MSFIAGAVALSLVAALALLWPLWSARQRNGGDEHQAVVALIRARLDELEQERAAGLLDEAGYEQLKLEQQRRLLDESAAPAGRGSRRGAGLLLAAVAVLVPLAAFLLYDRLGASTDWQIQQLVERTQNATSDEAHRAALNELAPLLRRQIERRGDGTVESGGRRRFLLARVEMERGEPAAAAEQYGLLAEQFPQDAAIAGQHAQARYLASGRQLTPQIRAEAERALQIDPDQSTALGLLGIAAFERGDYAEALKHWRRLQAQLPPGSSNAQIIADGIRRAEAMAGEPGESATEASGPRLAVTVSVAPELQARIPADATLFVFVRAANGPPMPLAAQKRPVGDWPVTLELSDAQAMMAGMNLSSLVAAGGAGELVARITTTGDVRAQPGDFEGVLAVELGGTLQRAAVAIDRRL